MYYSSILRILAIGIKGSFILLLPFYLTPSEVGLYGLIVALIFFGVLLIGGDFYTYSQRKLVSSAANQRAFVLKNQFIAHLILYCILFPIGVLFFPADIIPVQLLVIFLILLITEHVSSELNRILLVFQLHLIASKLMVFRVVWIIVLIPLMHGYENARTIDVILNFWFANTAISILFYCFIIKTELSGERIWQEDYSLTWIFWGFRGVVVYFLSTLVLRSLTVLDRMILEHNLDLTILGVYTVYMSLAMLVGLVVDGGIMQYYYPKLISSVGKGSSKEALVAIVKSMVVKTGGVVIIGVGLLYIFTEDFLNLLSDPLYLENIGVLWWLLLVSSAFSFMLIPHFVLYAYHLDRENLLANALSLCVFILINYYYSTNLTILTMAHSLAISFVVMLTVKTVVACRKISQHI